MSSSLAALPEGPPPAASEVGHWDVPPDPLAARSLRHEVQARWGVQRPLTEDPASISRLLLVLTELVTNAVQHGDQSIDVRLGRTAAGWLVVVTEVPPPRPRRHAPSSGWRDGGRHEDGTGGRGLAIVSAISARCGRRMVGTGLQVWSEVPVSQRALPSDGDDDPAGGGEPAG